MFLQTQIASFWKFILQTHKLFSSVMCFRWSGLQSAIPLSSEGFETFTNSIGCQEGMHPGCRACLLPTRILIYLVRIWISLIFSKLEKLVSLDCIHFHGLLYILSYTDYSLALLSIVTYAVHTGITNIMFLSLFLMSGIFAWEPYIQECRLFKLHVEHLASGVQGNKDSHVLWNTNLQVSSAKTHYDWL